MNAAINHLRRLKRDVAGVTAIEFAVVAPVLFILVFGIIETGQLIFTKQQLHYAVESAVRSVMINPAMTESEIRTHILNKMSIINDIDLVVIAPMGTTFLNSIEMRSIIAEYDFDFLVPYSNISPMTLTSDGYAIVN